MKQKKPIYKRKWFIILVVILVLGLAGSVFGNGDKGKATNTSKSTSTTQEVEKEESTTQPTESEEEHATTSEETAQAVSDEDIRPEFKEAMDDYEAWFDHYVEVMKAYKDNPSDIELLTEVNELIAEEEPMLEKLDNMDESEMTNAELSYYIEVTARIEKKLLEVAE